MAKSSAQKIEVHEGKDLKWTASAKKKVEKILAKYPDDQSRSATIPLLWLAQKEFGGWVSVDAMQLVADTLSLPYIRVYEVATFYTMFNLKPVGKYHVQVCTNCACMIRGSEKIVDVVKEATGLSGQGTISDDGLFTLTEVECLGACVEAPMMQINDGYHVKLTPESTVEILEGLKAGKTVKSTTPSKGLEIFDGK
ncbi:MAG: NAD(P)H-dependent oxidoreductase subunit E [Alphaproteobacteria bacterium]|jgi:NADH-quinone oxidoreductase subunit E|nr:NAD(P)H-dependent oxidoreductase subunit E [Alphaproteobacteria bacterium]